MSSVASTICNGCTPVIDESSIPRLLFSDTTTRLTRCMQHQTQATWVVQSPSPRSDNGIILTIAKTTPSDIHLSLIPLIGIGLLSQISLNGVRSGKPTTIITCKRSHVQLIPYVSIVSCGSTIMFTSIEEELFTSLSFGMFPS